MDANDEKLINEQIHLLQNKQLMLQHATQNQITVLNMTIVHIENIETIIDRNEKLLQRRIIMRYLDREEINEHCIVLIAVITDLIRDAENIIEYLIYIQKGSMHPKLIFSDEINRATKRGDTAITAGIIFPF